MFGRGAIKREILLREKRLGCRDIAARRAFNRLLRGAGGGRGLANVATAATAASLVMMAYTGDSRKNSYKHADA